jgi:hypothetical protein
MEGRLSNYYRVPLAAKRPTGILGHSAWPTLKRFSAIVGKHADTDISILKQARAELCEVAIAVFGKSIPIDLPLYPT